MPADVVPDYDEEDNSTREIELPTPQILTEQSAERLALCLLACAGIDIDTLRALGQRPQGAREPTVLQQVLNRVTWTALDVPGHGRGRGGDGRSQH